jgi:hypothetical protein
MMSALCFGFGVALAVIADLSAKEGAHSGYGIFSALISIGWFLRSAAYVIKDGMK